MTKDEFMSRAGLSELEEDDWADLNELYMALPNADKDEFALAYRVSCKLTEPGMPVPMRRIADPLLPLREMVDDYNGAREALREKCSEFSLPALHTTPNAHKAELEFNVRMAYVRALASVLNA